MKKISECLIIVLTLIALLSLTACGAKEKTLEGAEQAAVLAFSEGATDNLFAGMTAGDYAIFSRDFDADMQKAMPESIFATWKEDMDSTLGRYLSREVNQVVQAGDFYAVIYRATFEQEEPVTVRVVFRVAEPHSVSGLWFDSEKLRQK
jgi:hypothetical protein